MKKKKKVFVYKQTNLTRRQEKWNLFSNHCDPRVWSSSLLLQKMLGKYPQGKVRKSTLKRIENEVTLLQEAEKFVDKT